jgi:1-acyl-sn-glycerol-3-phosphate acyltransferase
MPAALVWRRAATAAIVAWSHAALWGTQTIAGIKVRLEGQENIPHGAAIVAVKHQAMLDTIVPFVWLPSPILVLKQELLNAPLYGWFARRGGMIPVARDAHAAALKSMLRAARPHAEAGRQIVIFPEGTRKAPGDAPDYKPGVAALYRDLAKPVVPVALNTGLCWPAKGLIRRSGVVTVRFLPAIPPGLARAEFMRVLEDTIETASAALAAPERGRPAPQDRPAA